MGWYPIDPSTGQMPDGKSSSLSKPPDFVLLNAVPGADNAEGEHYLGDGPWDMGSTMPKEFADITDTSRWTVDDIRGLMLQDKPPQGVDGETMDDLREVVDAFWKDIDTCYEDDWDRGATAAEKYWITEQLIEQMKPR